MVRRNQHIPDIDFERFAFGGIKELFDENEIHINPDYQRGDVWSASQQVELIRSIFNSYSVGVLVLYINDDGKFEILDGQQRLLTINKYLRGQLNLNNSGLELYADLNKNDKFYIDAYAVGYLKLKSHNPETKEEDIIQTFLRLQEGTPLNKAEKISAHRGAFKNAFKEVRESHKIFNHLGNDKRFRLRLLCAEMLHLEIKSDFSHSKFPGLELQTLKDTCVEYEKSLSKNKLRQFKGNLDFLQESLNYLLTAMVPRDLIPFYLLVSYLRKNKADNSNLVNELSLFCKEFLEKVNSFSVYDVEPPEGMGKIDFNDYLEYKKEGRKATSPDSIEFRFVFLNKHFKKYIPFIQKDPERLHDAEQKRILFFRQQGVCPECGNGIDFRTDGSAHHVLAHKNGGKTSNLKDAVLLHEKCHVKLHKKLDKA